jgi:hypothetical protein
MRFDTADGRKEEGKVLENQLSSDGRDFNVKPFFFLPAKARNSRDFLGELEIGGEFIQVSLGFSRSSWAVAACSTCLYGGASQKYISILFSISNFKSINFTYLMLKWIGFGGLARVERGKHPSQLRNNKLPYENNSIFLVRCSIGREGGGRKKFFSKQAIERMRSCVYANGNCVFLASKVAGRARERNERILDLTYINPFSGICIESESTQLTEGSTPSTFVREGKLHVTWKKYYLQVIQLSLHVSQV